MRTYGMVQKTVMNPLRTTEHNAHLFREIFRTTTVKCFAVDNVQGKHKRQMGERPYLVKGWVAKWVKATFEKYTCVEK